MRVEPQGRIYICHDIPLDPTYQHSLWWSGAGEQIGYFQGMVKHALTDYSYMRQNRTIKVAIPADKLYDCNYLLFQNTGFGTKWWYAFITNIEYINNDNSEISWELDVLQTWYFDYHLGSCFVEREHAARDEIGDNIVPENLELGEYVLSNPARPSAGMDGGGAPYLQEQSVVLATTTMGSGDDTVVGYYSGFPVASHYTVFPTTGGRLPADIALALNTISRNGHADAIISVFLCPTIFVTANGGNAQIRAFTMSKRTTNAVFDGYDVKNKKLFTYPFNMLYCNNMQGASAVFPYEFFDGGNATFRMTANMNPNGQAIIWPTNYKGVSQNYDERLSLQINPEVSYSVDVYKNTIAQKGLAGMLNGVISSMGAGAGVAGLMGASEAVATGAGIANALAAEHQAITQPPQSHGSIGGDSLFSADLMDFFFYNKHITRDMAERIDSYFTMFGYATKKLKVPNRHARTSFTYTKTIDCVATGSVPAQDMAKICSIYDSGVTWWRNKNAVGDYTVANQPTGSEGE